MMLVEEGKKINFFFVILGGIIQRSLLQQYRGSSTAAS